MISVRRFALAPIVQVLCAVVFFGCGCVAPKPFEVKDTEGIRSLLNDVADAEILAIALKAARPEPPQEIVDAGKLYDVAVGEVRKFINGVLDDANNHLVVDVSVASYEASEANRAIDAFNEKKDLVAIEAVPGPWEELGVAAAAFVIKIINGIDDLHRKERDAALDRFTSYLNRGEMYTFEAVNDDRLHRKYIGSEESP